MAVRISPITIVQQLKIVPSWVKYSFTHTQFHTAGLISSAPLITLPAKGVIAGIFLKPTIPFSGTATCDIAVGTDGSSPDKYMAVHDVTQAISGLNFKWQIQNVVPSVENMSDPTVINLWAVATVDNLDQLTAGAVDVWIQTSSLPE